MPALTDEIWTQIRYDYEHTDRLIVDICAEHGISANTLRDRVRRWGWTKRRAPIPRVGPPAVAAPKIETEAETFALFTSPHGGEVGSPLAAFSPRGGDPGEGALAVERPRPPHPNPLPEKGVHARLRRAMGEREQTVRAADVSALAEPIADPAAIAPRLQSAVARVLPAIEAIIAKLAGAPMPPREIEQTARALGTLTRTLRELNALLAQQPPQAANAYDDMPEDMDAFRNELARRIELLLAEPPEENVEGEAADGTPA